MRCFLLYISDWKASKQISRMDASEERGYLRLLLDAAESSDCGLPDNDQELRIISLLRKQWNKESLDEDYRYDGEQSGRKLRACFFFVKDGKAFNAADGTPYIPSDAANFSVEGCLEGRLYNERLLREFRHQKDVKKKREKASEAGVEARRQKSAGKLFGESLEELYDEPDGLSLEDRTVNQVVDQMVNQTDNKLSLCLGLKNTSNTDKASSEITPAISVITEPEGIPDRLFEIATRFQSVDGFNVPAAFKFFAVLYPREGRVRLETAFGVFATRIDESKSGRLAAFCRMLLGLEKWKASAQWERGAINHIGNWFGERLYLEEPVSAREAAEKYAKPEKTATKRESAMDRIRAKAKENESRRSA